MVRKRESVKQVNARDKDGWVLIEKKEMCRRKGVLRQQPRLE